MRIDRDKTEGRSEIVEAAERIRALCSVVTKVARADLEAHLKEHDSGISAIEHGVLRHLSHGVTSMAEISRLMGVAPSTLVYVVDGLTERKLVKRVKDPKDRRREPLVLEKKGAGVFARSPKMDAGSSLVRGLESMPAMRRRELVSLLEELVKELAGPERMYLNTEAKEPAAKRSKRRRGEAKS